MLSLAALRLVRGVQPNQSPLLQACRETISSQKSRVFLAPTSHLFNYSAGLKHVGVPKLRCKHCYYVIKDEVKYVMCTAKPRHMQAEKMVAAKQGNMILTHATQGSAKKVRGSRAIKSQNSFRMDF